ncbi:MAG TPA: IS110 family transposase [Thermodesulfovibrionales bacterium]|nr:IS110 family transposase [Thermodesulfovibrionales bacterium]
MKKYSKFVGLDVHKTEISVGMANAERGDAGYYGTIENKAHCYVKLAKKLSKGGEEVLFCYEAGPCGYDVYRQLRKAGYDCMVVAPSLIPKKAGDRVKTDRRDAVSLARLLRAGELTGIWVPDKEQEAMRDLTRAREDVKAMERQSRQRLGGFLLRHGKVYPGQSKWTKTYFCWLESQRFETATQQIVFQEYIDMVKDAGQRVAAMEEEMRKALNGWTLKPVVEGLMALRGVDLIAAMTIIAELGDITRFESPRQLMAHLGLVPSEHSSGERRKRGGITKTGNGHVRRVLVEASWSYRLPARKTGHLRRKAEKASKAVQEIAWKGQKRLCNRYWYLVNKGKLPVESCTAVARELVGFIWAIACEVMGKGAVGVSMNI